MDGFLWEYHICAYNWDLLPHTSTRYSIEWSWRLVWNLGNAFFIWSCVSAGMLNRCVHLGLSLQVHILIAHTLAKVFFIQLFLKGKDRQLKHPNTAFFIASAISKDSHTHVIPFWSWPHPERTPASPAVAFSACLTELVESCKSIEGKCLKVQEFYEICYIQA